MKIVNVKQGSPEWIRARLGIPTASCFDKIVTKGGKLSASSDRYLAQLCAEWFMGAPVEDYQSGLMERGSELEQEAVRFYEFDRGEDTAAVGLCLTDDGKVGASPDRLVKADGLLEVKCPGPVVHMANLLGELTDEYRVQVQGQLWVTGRKWCDQLYFHPNLPQKIIRHQRDELFIALLEGAVSAFVVRLDAAKAKLADQKAEHLARRDQDVPAEVC